jgi:glycosyltransferase involved in cell wall biosynthesis
VGRLSPEKGYKLLAAAAADAACPVTFVGEGLSRSEIQAANPQAKITGWRSREAVLELLRGARALVLPSLWYEAQPLVTQEASALGIPVIVSDACAAREQVVDGKTGLLFRGGDQQDLARKLKMMQDEELAQQMGAATYETYWRNPPTMAAHLDALEDCYQAVLYQ